MSNKCALLRYMIGTVGEMLVKYTSKRKKILGKIQENINVEFDENANEKNIIFIDKLFDSAVRVNAFVKFYKHIQYRDSEICRNLEKLMTSPSELLFTE